MCVLKRSNAPLWVGAALSTTIILDLVDRGLIVIQDIPLALFAVTRVIGQVLEDQQRGIGVLSLWKVWSSVKVLPCCANGC